MISQTAEYALRAAVQLAGNPDVPLTTRGLAAATQAPLPYLSKVMQGLARAGIVKPHRGIRGGFTLVRPAAEVSVYDIVQAVDPIHRIEGCPLGLLAHGRDLCPLHRRLDNAMRLVEDAFRASSLKDLLPETGPDVPLCAAPERGKPDAPIK